MMTKDMGMPGASGLGEKLRIVAMWSSQYSSAIAFVHFHAAFQSHKHHWFLSSSNACSIFHLGASLLLGLHSYGFA
jgi:hypothetical protein